MARPVCENKNWRRRGRAGYHRLIFAAILVIALYITSKRFQHKYHPKPMRKMMGQEDKPH